MDEREKPSISNENPIGGEMGQAPLVNADIAQDFAKAAGWMVNRIRTDRTSFVDTFIKNPLKKFPRQKLRQRKKVQRPLKTKRKRETETVPAKQNLKKPPAASPSRRISDLRINNSIVFLMWYTKR